MSLENVNELCISARYQFGLNLKKWTVILAYLPTIFNILTTVISPMRKKCNQLLMSDKFKGQKNMNLEKTEILQIL